MNISPRRKLFFGCPPSVPQREGLRSGGGDVAPVHQARWRAGGRKRRCERRRPREDQVDSRGGDDRAPLGRVQLRRLHSRDGRGAFPSLVCERNDGGAAGPAGGHGGGGVVFLLNN